MAEPKDDATMPSIATQLREWAAQSGPTWYGVPIVLAAADEIARLTAEVERLNATVCRSSASGEIIYMDYSEEIGVYFGSIRCPECESEVQIRPCDKRPRCTCGIEWDFDVSATGTREGE